MGDFVQVKKSLCHSEFKAKQVCEVIDIDYTDKHGFDVLIQGKNYLDWVNHKDLKKYIKRKPKPQPKQLDQSVFDGLDADYNFAAIDGCSGRAYAYEEKPYTPVGRDYWRVHVGLWQRVDDGYDTSNWQNSIIERDDIAKELLEIDLSKELTGSELCKAMLARGDTRIMCRVYDIDRQHDITHVIRAYSDGKFHTKANRWTFAIPINNQGEPLTARDVGI